ncbi:Aminotransferase atnJ [Penicillium diatomitis]|uniref:Aminotransferase atnJ n=1 Tax=Penicillium diatomitis TaxID=2819901 RepID=A0A9W9XGH2_9EURO|nr:Aminotransferase atnJ [Penicillium diatomitis]KAJ5491764.1 Aminotransferase atnJ [Penicillium diatomitis]
MTFPPAPAPDVDWTKLGLAVTDMVNGHVQSTYSVETGEWSAPRLVVDPFIRVHGLAPGLNYGQQVYEGLKAYRTRNGKIQIFRPEYHAARMQHSAAVVSIPSVPIDHFMTVINAAVARNAEWVPPYESGAALYIRPVLFGSSGHLALTPPNEYTLCVYVHPFSSYHGVAPLPAVVMEEFDRAAPKGAGHAKIGGNYAPVMKWSQEASKAGFPMTLHLDSKTGEEIDEFSTSGFIGVRSEETADQLERVVLVVPKSDNIINSVTSNSLMEIGRALGYQVENRSVKYWELSTFSEVMAVGTAACLVPISSITHRSHDDYFQYTKEKTAGPICQKLYAELTSVQRGDSEEFPEWSFEVQQAYV